MKVKKAITTILATVVTMFTLSLPAFAQAPPLAIYKNSAYYSSNGVVISPFFTETSYAAANISLSGKTVYPEISVQANNLSTKISGTLYLDKSVSGSWQQITSWSVSGTGSLNLSKSYTATSGTTYRSRFVVTVGSEKIERSSSSCIA